MKPIVGITIGDPAGIGPEIVLKALAGHPQIFECCRPLVIGNCEVLEAAQRFLDHHLPLQSVDDLSEFSPEPGLVPCYEVSFPQEPIELGREHARGGRASFQYIKTAIELAMKSEMQALATAPINKEALQLADVGYLDHTEMLTTLSGSKHSMTLFVTGDLRIFFYSRHIAFREIVDALDIAKLVEQLQFCDQYLKQLGFSNPKVALAALNPHGGEQGMFGREEIEILEPAVAQAQKLNLDIIGPIPADSVFHQTKEGRYDAVLSLYHDQGHIAAKTFDFHGTISLTMGLPFIRTSVDHGTAMDIAGKNIADERGMVEAILAAAKYSISSTSSQTSS